MVVDTLMRQMLEAFEVSHVGYFVLARTPFCLGSDFEFSRGQQLKERSCRKSLFICHESGVWAALLRQRALVEEANQRLSKKSAEADELRVVITTLKEEAGQAQDTAAKALEDTAKAREEAANVTKPTKL
jgi:hypothetical protein